MRLLIQGTSTEKSGMPYVRQLKSLLDAGPVGMTKPNTDQNVIFFGHENPDHFFLFEIPNITLNTANNLSVDDDCGCEYCSDLDGSTESWKCDQEEEIFESADIDELMRVDGTGQSFTGIVDDFNDDLAKGYHGLDFIVGMKSELPNNVTSIPLTGCVLEANPDEINSILANAFLITSE